MTRDPLRKHYKPWPAGGSWALWGFMKGNLELNPLLPSPSIDKRLRQVIVSRLCIAPPPSRWTPTSFTYISPPLRRWFRDGEERYSLLQVWESHFRKYLRVNKKESVVFMVPGWCVVCGVGVCWGHQMDDGCPRLRSLQRFIVWRWRGAEEEEHAEYWAHLSPCSLTSLFCQRLLPPLHRSILPCFPMASLFWIIPTCFVSFFSLISSFMHHLISFPSFFLLTFAFPPTLYLPPSLFLLSSSFSTSSSLSLHPPPSPLCGWFLPCGGCNSLRDRWAGAAIIPSPAAFDGSPSSAVGVILRASGC